MVSPMGNITESAVGNYSNGPCAVANAYADDNKVRKYNFEEAKQALPIAIEKSMFLWDRDFNVTITMTNKMLTCLTHLIRKFI